MAKIRITNLPLSVIIGTTPKERENRQTVHLDLSFEYDSAKPEQSDSLSDAVDYETLADKIIAKAQATRFQLIEKLARFILDIAMEDKRVLKASATISKPKAVSQADAVTITLTDEG